MFILPGGSGEFVSVTATFRKLDGTTTTVTSTNKTTDNGKADKVWMQTPVGWALIQPTTAVVTDDAKSDKFNLTHTCAAGGGSTPTPTPTGTKPTTPTPTPSTSASTTATPSSPGATPSGTKPAESTPAPTGSTTVPPVTEPSGGNLPTTGIALTGLFAAAGAALAAGLFMRSVRRRRVETVLPE
ncbi:LPXTG cell wall anchor domain-containing protein [Longispora albida]|uniref:LPXTG cell wall anchor domain-containing protein n=1 Tax=Longispora albida TaxID=203523 RepID=UPI00037152EF|nr:LPXTG cell wall anchor domain-containing protein [Longispora albida]